MAESWKVSNIMLKLCTRTIALGQMMYFTWHGIRYMQLSGWERMLVCLGRMSCCCTWWSGQPGLPLLT